MTRRRLMVVLGLLLAAAAALWLAWPETPPPGVSRETARLIRDLQARPSGIARRVSRMVRRIHPPWLYWLPDFLLEDSAGARNVMACHRLMALGPAVKPALPLLLEAFRDPDPSVSFYAYLVVVYSGLPAAEFVTLARQPPADPQGPVHFYAGLLSTEDERLREYAWDCLEASGDAARAVRERLSRLAEEGDAAERRRAAALLARLEAQSSGARSVTNLPAPGNSRP